MPVVSKMLQNAVQNCLRLSRPRTVIVEGNIASGKTTFLDYFSQFSSQVETVAEPVNKWRDVRGHNLLALFYEDQTRWNFPLQSFIQLTMLQQHLKPSCKPVSIMERSLFSAKYCFVENLRRNGKMSEVEFAVIDEWFQYLKENIPPVDLIIYLRTSPKTVYDRLLKRRIRPEESVIPLDYLEQLHNLHEEWLREYKYVPYPSCEILEVNADQELPALLRDYDHLKNRIIYGDERREAEKLIDEQKTKQQQRI